MEPHILLQMPLFRGITEETLLKFVLLHQHTLKSYKPGEFIAMQGDIYPSLYILCNGTVRTQMVSAEGKQLTIETLRAPKLLAPAFIFASENRFPVLLVLVVDGNAGCLHDGNKVWQQLVRRDFPYPIEIPDDPQHCLVDRFLGAVIIMQNLLRFSIQRRPVPCVYISDKLPVIIIFNG